MTSKALALRRFSRSPRGLISRPRRLFVSVSSFFPRLRVGVDRRTTFSILEQHRVLIRYENGGGKEVWFSVKRFFVLWVKSRMCCLSFITSRSIYYARSLSLSLSLSRRDHRAAQTPTRTQKRIISRASSLFLSLLKFCFSSVFLSFIDTKTRDSFKQQRSVAHRIWTLLELDACTVRLL